MPSLHEQKRGRHRAPSLRDVQEGMCRNLLAGDDAVAPYVVEDGIAAADRLAIYRNTFVSVATRALRLNYPAIVRLVGDDFFGAAAQAHIAECPPASPWLDAYGEAFALFLASWPAARSLSYLFDVARLEWAVSRALHAQDANALDAAALARLAALEPDAQASIRLVPHPSLQLIRTDFPADAIWGAVLARDDDALGAIDLGAGSRWLLVERTSAGVDVVPMLEAEWRFTSELCSGLPLQEALDRIAPTDVTPDIDPAALIARHLAAGRVVAFHVDTSPGATPPKEIRA